MIFDSVHFHENNLIAIGLREFVHNLVPRLEELEAPAALRHEKVDNDESVGTGRLNQVLKLPCIVCLLSFCALPPVNVHFYSAFLFLSIWARPPHLVCLSKF